MPRAARQDEIGSTHHVMNRGLARRTVFESARDLRFFLSRVARVVRAGDFELIAYSLLSTHFHLLVVSRHGTLSRAMGWVENQYVRWFNRSRRRDGSLFRGRFTSVPVQSEAHRRAVIDYIDRNAVEARLVASPAEHPWSSAWHRARGRRPRWLSLHDDRSHRVVDAAATAWIVERRLAAGRTRVGAEVRLDDLVASAPARVREWMTRKAALADGSGPGHPVAAPAALLAAIAGTEAASAVSASGSKGVTAAAEHRARVAGLARLLCGATWKEIGALLSISPMAAVDAAARWHLAVRANDREAERAAAIAADAIGRTFGSARATGSESASVLTPPPYYDG